MIRHGIENVTTIGQFGPIHHNHIVVVPFQVGVHHNADTFIVSFLDETVKVEHCGPALFERGMFQHVLCGFQVVGGVFIVGITGYGQNKSFNVWV
jgi:hypothetical protein